MFKIPFKPAGRAPLRDKENTQVEPVDVRSSIKLEPGLKNLQVGENETLRAVRLAVERNAVDGSAGDAPHMVQQAEAQQISAAAAMLQQSKAEKVAEFRRQVQGRVKEQQRQQHEREQARVKALEEKVAAAMAREAAIKAHAEKLEEQRRLELAALEENCEFDPDASMLSEGDASFSDGGGMGSPARRRQQQQEGPSALQLAMEQVEENLARARNALLAFRTLRTRAPELQLQQQVQAEVKAAGSQSPGPEQPRTLVPMPTGGAAGSPGRPRTAGGAAGSPGRGSPGRGSPSRPGTAAAAAAAQAPGRAWNSGLRDDTDTTKQEDRHVLAAVRTIEMHRSRKIAHDRAVARSQSPLRAKDTSAAVRAREAQAAAAAAAQGAPVLIERHFAPDDFVPNAHRQRAAAQMAALTGQRGPAGSGSAGARVVQGAGDEREVLLLNTSAGRSQSPQRGPELSEYSGDTGAGAGAGAPVSARSAGRAALPSQASVAQRQMAERFARPGVAASLSGPGPASAGATSFALCACGVDARDPTRTRHHNNCVFYQGDAGAGGSSSSGGGGGGSADGGDGSRRFTRAMHSALSSLESAH